MFRFLIISFSVLLLAANAYAEKAEVIKAIRHTSDKGDTRVVIDLSGPVDFESGRISGPERLFIDISGCSLGSAKKTIDVGDGVVKKIRSSQYAEDTARVVLDLDSFKDFKVTHSNEPPRIIIDVRGGSTTPDKGLATSSKGSVTPAKKSATGSSLSPSATPSKKMPVAIDEDLRHIKVGKVVIDAGHGGHDPGAIGPGGLREKDVVLDIALNLKRLLVKDGYEVLLTRSTDLFLSLDERTVFANRSGADLFVSVHANANPNKAARGIETYLLNWTDDEEAMKVAARENKISLRRMREARSDLDSILASLELQNKRDESLRLAHGVQRSMVSGLLKSYDGIRDLGVKQAFFYVLLGANMPSVLVEVSFISNKEEAKRLKSKPYRQQLASGIASGIKAYIESDSAAALPVRASAGDMEVAGKL